jgi:hypothetical protein
MRSIRKFSVVSKSQEQKAKSKKPRAKSQELILPFISCPALQWFLSEGPNLACPFFVPREILNDGFWPHPSRLPLGAGWTGNCRASGQELAASDAHIREFCNLGYATACPNLPQHRDWDAIRFSVARASRDQVMIAFVCELAHAPIEHGKLTFDLVSEVWLNAPTNPRVLALATCYLQTYRARQSALLI